MKAGETVVVWRDDGTALITKTRSDSWELDNGQEVVQVKGISGSYAIDKVREVMIHDSVTSEFKETAPSASSNTTQEAIADCVCAELLISKHDEQYKRVFSAVGCGLQRASVR